MTVADYIGAFRSYLLSEAGISGLVGTRIFASAVPVSEAVNMPRKIVVLSPASGSYLLESSYLATSERTLDVRCYGETAYEAWLVHQQVYSSLKSMRSRFEGAVKLFWASPYSTGETLRDPDTEWDFVFSSWRVYVADYEAV